MLIQVNTMDVLGFCVWTYLSLSEFRYLVEGWNHIIALAHTPTPLEFLHLDICENVDLSGETWTH